MGKMKTWPAIPKVPQTQQAKAQSALQKLSQGSNSHQSAQQQWTQLNTQLTATSGNLYTSSPGTLYTTQQYPGLQYPPTPYQIDISTPESELSALDTLISYGSQLHANPYSAAALQYLIQRRETVRQKVLAAEEKERLKTAMVETAVAGESLRDRVLDLIGAMEEEDAPL